MKRLFYAFQIYANEVLLFDLNFTRSSFRHDPNFTRLSFLHNPNFTQLSFWRDPIFTRLSFRRDTNFTLDSVFDSIIILHTTQFFDAIQILHATSVFDVIRILHSTLVFDVIIITWSKLRDPDYVIIIWFGSIFAKKRSREPHVSRTLANNGGFLWYFSEMYTLNISP